MSEFPAPDPAQRSSDPTLSAKTVAVNLLWCVPGEVGGSEQYLVRQLVGLSTQPSGFIPTIFCSRAFVDAHPELEQLYPMVTAPVSGRRRSSRVAAEHSWLARRTRSFDLVHHGGGTAPARGGSPVILTIHDLQYETFPEYLSTVKLRYLRSVMPKSVARADIITVPTEYVKSTVVSQFRVAPDRVAVVPHGVEPTFGSNTRSEFELRRDFGLGRGRVLVLPAITHPHKGHEFLLEVMARYWTDPELRLVLLGGRGAAHEAVMAAIDRHDLGRRVVHPGRVSDGDRDGLIALADALVFPSEYEGFGAPVVEAMALGTPVVSSDQPALREVVGDAAVVRPLVHDAWASALDTVEARRPDLVAAGHRRAALFTAAKSGEALSAAYRLAETKHG